MRYIIALTDDAKLYQENGRTDLSDAYTEEANILSELLPKASTNEEIEKFVEGFIKDTYDSRFIDTTNIGTTIKSVKTKFPSADGKTISDIVRTFVVRKKISYINK